jgi:hypothetical protein
MRNENVPNSPSPETPPLAPYDPPAPAPQAAAWRLALKVVGYTPPGRAPRLGKTTVVKTLKSAARPAKWM